MKKKKVTKRIFALLLSAALLVSGVQLPATVQAGDTVQLGAEDTQPVNVITSYPTVLEAEDQGEGIHYYNNHADTGWSDVVSGGKTVGGIDTSAMQANGTVWPTAKKLNNGSYNFEENKDALPYVSYTVKVAQSAVYEMKVGYIMSDNNRADHKMLLYVDGQAYEAPYTKSDKYTGAYSESSVQVALQAGENTIYCIPFDAAYRTANGGAWLNQDYLSIERVAELEYTRMEAETYGITNNYPNIKTDDGRYSGGAAVGGASWSSLLAYADYKEGVDLSGQPYVQYRVKADTAGDYMLKIGYLFGERGNTADQYMIVFVNGKTAYKAMYAMKGTEAAVVEASVAVSLKSGINTITCIPFDSDQRPSNPNGWINQDYLDIQNSLTPVASRQEAEDQGEGIHYYNNHADTGWSNVVSGGKTVGGMSTTAMQTNGTAWPTAVGINNGSYSFDANKANLPYVAYQVQVEETGVYEMKVGYIISGDELATHKMLLYVDGQAYEAPYTKSDKYTGAYSESSVRVALQAGENKVYCIPFDATYRTANGSAWLNQDYLETGKLISSEKTVTYTRVEAENTELTRANGYTNVDRTWESGRGIVVMGGAPNPTTGWPTAETLNDGSFTKAMLQGIPYMAYNLQAEEAGTYKLKVGYMVAGGDYASHNMLLYVNGKAYQAPYNNTRTDGWQPYSESEVEVYLQVGENVIYCIPFEQNYKDNNKDAWLNQDYLEFPDEKLTAVTVPEEELVTYTRVEAEDTALTRANGYSSVNKTWEESRGIVVMGDAPNLKTGWPTAGTLNDGSFTEEMLQDIPYMAYNLQAEEAGTYKLKVGYMVVDGDYASHSMLLYVNGTAYEASYNNTRTDGWQPYSESEVEVYLQAGENVIYCIPFEQNYKDNNNNAWLNQDYLEFPDEKLTAVAVPEVQLPPTGRVEAEDTVYAETCRYTQIPETTWADNGIIVVGGASNPATGWPTLEGLNKGTYTEEMLRSIPYVAYNLRANKAGSYKLKVGYVVSGDNKASHNMLIYVNGKAYRAAYKQTTSWAGYSESKVTVDLKAGENTIYCIPFEQEYKDAEENKGKDIWVCQDYLEYPEALSAVKVTQYTRMEAENQGSDINRYRKTADTTWKEGRGIVVVGDPMINTYPTYKELNSGKYPQSSLNSVPYVAYDVAAPAKGTYKLKVGYMIAGKDDRYDHYMMVYVNGKAYKANYTPSTTKTDWPTYSESTVSVELKKGKNTIYCISFDQNYKKDAQNKNVWVNQDYLGLQEGLKPLNTKYTRMEAEEYAERNKYYDGKQEFPSVSGGYVVADGTFIDENMLPYNAFKAGVDLSKQAYVQYRVSANTAGEYTLKLGYIMGDRGDASKQYVIVFVNGTTAYKAYFHQRGDWAAYSESDVTVALQRGENTITCISFDADQRKYNPKAWLNPDYLGIPEGLTPLQPKVRYVKYEAETWAMLNNYTKEREEFKGTSGDAVVGGGRIYADDLLPYSSLAQGANVENQAYIEYTVKANSAGDYKLGIGYLFGNRKDTSKQYIVVLVNGKRAYKAYYERIGSWEAYSEASVTVSLDAGVNSIVCVATDKDQRQYNPKGYINFDYISIPDNLQMMPKRYNMVRYEAETYAESNLYSSLNEEFGGASGDHVIGGASVANSDLPKQEELQNGNVQLGNCSFIQYTVIAPSAGDYTIKVGYLLGEPTTDRKEHYLPVLINNKTMYKAEFNHNPDWGGPGGALTGLRVHLEQGTNTIILVPFSKEYKESNEKAWVCQDFIEVPSTLTMVAPESMKPVADGYVRFEAEEYTARNNYKVKVNLQASGGNLHRPIYYTKAQSIKQIRKNGIDGSNTPYVQYTLNASHSGTYQLEFGMFLAHEGNEYVKDGKVYIAVEINGELREVETTVTQILPKIFIYKTEAQLNEGENRIKITTCTSNSVSSDEMSAAYAMQDYLDVTEGVTAVSYGERLEAENCEASGYLTKDRANASNRAIMGDEEPGDVIFGKVTAKKLNKKTLAYTPYVSYELTAEEEGTYTIMLGIFNSQFNNVPSDVKHLVIGVVVNGEESQKVTYTPGVYMDHAIDVHLKKGSNTVAVTGILYDIHKYSEKVSARSWCDQDYIELPEGVHGVNTAVDDLGFGDDKANINDKQLAVDLANVKTSQTASNVPVLLIVLLSGGGVGLAGVLWLIIRSKKKMMI